MLHTFSIPDSGRSLQEKHFPYQTLPASHVCTQTAWCNCLCSSILYTVSQKTWSWLLPPREWEWTAELSFVRKKKKRALILDVKITFKRKGRGGGKIAYIYFQPSFPPFSFLIMLRKQQNTLSQTQKHHDFLVQCYVSYLPELQGNKRESFWKACTALGPAKETTRPYVVTKKELKDVKSYTLY